MKDRFLIPALAAATLVVSGCDDPTALPPEPNQELRPSFSTITAASEVKLTASDAAADDLFGRSVSISGDLAIVGAFLDDDPCHPNNVFCNTGSAYIFRRTETGWSEEAKLTAGDAASGDNFGFSVSISGDLAVVGAVEDDQSGSAYIFRRTGTSWSQEAKLTANDAAPADQFGGSVSISGDLAIVGAGQNDDAGTGSGSAYIFRRAGTSWSQETKLTASDAAAIDFFGLSVSISGDRAIVGAHGPDDAGHFAGSAYIFTRTGTGWSEEAKLTASDAAVGDQFGFSVSISGDLAIVGADQNDDACPNNEFCSSGSAYIFSRTGPSWSEEAKLTASDAGQGSHFGWSVSISGGLAVVGGPFADSDGGPGSGSAYIFRLTGTSWSEEAKLTASDAGRDATFGWSVSISGDLAIVGAAGDDDAGRSSGAAYVYEASNVVDMTPPSLTVTATPASLWPPNHKYVTIGLSVVVSDAGDPNPAVTAVVESSEPDDANGNGDGRTTGDIRVTTSGGSMVWSSNEAPRVAFDPVNDGLEVRAERAGSGPGRTYTLTVTAIDASNNKSTETVTVTVPHDRR